MFMKTQLIANWEIVQNMSDCKKAFRLCDMVTIAPLFVFSRNQIKTETLMQCNCSNLQMNEQKDWGVHG